MEQSQPPLGVNINPRQIHGRWDDGYALDVHTVESVFVGHNAYGHPDFHNTRSPLGELLYQLKYRGNRTVVDQIVHTVANFLNSWGVAIDAIVPVPPSNTARKNQPVVEIARGVSAISGIGLCELCVTKVKNTRQIKNIYGYQKRMALLGDAFAIDREKTCEKRLLLFDDLYRSGATVNAIAQVLRNDGGPEAVYVLALTWARSTL